MYCAVVLLPVVVDAQAARAATDHRSLQRSAPETPAEHGRPVGTSTAGPRPGRPLPPQCPRSLECEWIPAGRALLGDGSDVRRYGHYDVARRGRGRHGRPPVRYLVIHDTESSYRSTVAQARDPAWPASWHYTVRSADGHVVQHVRLEDVSWNSGNWYVNTQAIGIEHEGYAAAPDAWFTEDMYRASARLVRYLAQRYQIPLDRAHVLGHDDVPAPIPAKVPTMHRDPGPYWDWAHYFDLLGQPLPGYRQAADAPYRADQAQRARRWTSGFGAVYIAPRYRRNVQVFTDCVAPEQPCPAHASSEVVLRTAPSSGASLLPDPGLHPDGSPSTMAVFDQGSRASTGQRFAVADRRGVWIAIWYQGRKGWFADPPGARTVVWSRATLVTPRPGRASIPVYGVGYPESKAYPAGQQPEPVIALPYRIPAGQWYAVAGNEQSMFHRARTFDGSDPGDRTTVRGRRRYVTIQFGHRLAFLDAADVTVRRVGTGR